MTIATTILKALLFYSAIVIGPVLTTFAYTRQCTPDDKTCQHYNFYNGIIGIILVIVTFVIVTLSFN